MSTAVTLLRRIKQRLIGPSMYTTPYRRVGRSFVTFTRPPSRYGPDSVLLLALTNVARPELLIQTIEAADKMLIGPIARKVIADDSKDPAKRQWLEDRFPDWEVVKVPPRVCLSAKARTGFCAAWAGAIDIALAADQQWVFWLEDDFVINEPIHLTEMQAAMDRRPGLAQIALKRQAWYPHEIAVGGIIEVDPKGYIQRDGWVEHRRHWTTNPNLTRRSLFEEHPWSKPPSCELRFGWTLLKDPNVVFGLWGRIEDEPKATHIGVESAGSGY